MRWSLALAATLLSVSISPALAEEAAPPDAAGPPAAEGASPPAPAPVVEPVAPVEPLPPAAPEQPPTTPKPRAAAPAQRKSGFQGLMFGVRAAYALPFGDYAGLVNSSGSTAMRDEFAHAIPVTFEAGLRMSEQLTVGAYYSRGEAREQPGALNGLCAAPNVRCNRGDMRRAGVQVLHRLDQDSVLLPWVGAGVGYEWTGIEVKGMPPITAFTAKGPEVNLQLGADYRASDWFLVGPYVLVSFARFTEAEIASDVTVTQEFAKPRIHGWLMLGVRCTFELGPFFTAAPAPAQGR